jgi:predicted transcriptional regulator
LCLVRAVFEKTEDVKTRDGKDAEKSKRGVSALGFGIDAASRHHDQRAGDKSEIHKVAIAGVKRVEAVKHAHQLNEYSSPGDFYADDSRSVPLIDYGATLPYLWDMEVHFTPEQEAQLAQIATRSGTDTERLVKDAALRLLAEDARFREAVREGLEQADRGLFIEEEEMDARFEKMLRS